MTKGRSWRGGSPPPDASPFGCVTAGLFLCRDRGFEDEGIDGGGVEPDVPADPDEGYRPVLAHPPQGRSGHAKPFAHGLGGDEVFGHSNAILALPRGRCQRPEKRLDTVNTIGTK